MRKVKKRINDLLAEGHKQKDIVPILNKEGFTTLRGKPFTSESLSRIKMGAPRGKVARKSSLIHNITDVLTSNIDETLNVRLIEALIK